MLSGLARYCLTTNPFRKDALDPLTKPGDCDLLARVDRFEALDEIQTTLDDSVANGKPAFFLISGANGTGRTSMARYILACYQDKRKIPVERLILPDVADGNVNHSALDYFQNWMIDLSSQMRDLLPDLSDLAREIKADANSVNPGVWEATFRDSARRVSRTLKNSAPPAAFAVFQERIPTLDIFVAAHHIFERVETVCVMTTAESTLAEQGHKMPTEGIMVEVLNRIKGGDAWKIIEHRWNTSISKTDLKNPFAPSGIVNGFAEPLPMGRIMLIMDEILKTKLDFAGPGDPWPDDPKLAFDEAQLLNFLRSRMRDWRQVVGI